MHTPDECIQDKPQRDFLARVGLKIDLLAVVTPLIHQVLAVLIPMSTTTVKLSHPGHKVPPLLIFLTRGCSSVNLHNGPHLLLRCQEENTKASTKGHIIRRACPGKHVHHDVACLRNPSKQASTVHFYRAVLNHHDEVAHLRKPSKQASPLRFYRAVLNTVQKAQSCTHSSGCMQAPELLSSQ